MINNQTLIDLDLKYIFHPCSQMKDYPDNIPLLPIKSAKGMYLYDYDNNSYMDAISSWWVNIFGHCHPVINKALSKQLQDLEHVIFAGFSHKPAIDLAQKLVEITPKGLDKVFFADNGSSAVEIALKMSFHYFKNHGAIKPLFIALENGYHGETIGALSVGDVDLYKKDYGELLFKTLKAKSPALVSESEALEDMKQLLQANKNQVCSVIIEPLIQCAGSMAMYNPSYLVQLRKLCDEFGVHLIADEIAVGFGRTGELFGFSHTEVAPDLMCLSKGLTAGYLPLSVCLLTNDIYQAFYANYNDGKSFLDSHSFTANTLACAVANRCINLFEEQQVIASNKVKAKKILQACSKIAELSNVKEIRQRGMVTAIELQNFNFVARDNLKIYRYCLNKGVFLRPLANVVYFMPPYIINDAEIEIMVQTAFEAIQSII